MSITLTIDDLIHRTYT